MNHAAPRNRFFVVMAALLLAIVLVGFSPSFLLKMFFATPALPWYLHLHGAALVGWFTLFFVQTLLVANHRTPTHRRVGVVASVAAVLLVVTTLVLILGAEASRVARGTAGRAPIEFVVLGDLASLGGFVVMMSISVALRQRSAQHKRAMLLAFIALVGPALGRISRFPVLSEPGVPFVIGSYVSLMLAVWVHDLVTERRVYAATGWGTAVLWSFFISASALTGTETGRAFVAAISFPVE